MGGGPVVRKMEERKSLKSKWRPRPKKNNLLKKTLLKKKKKEIQKKKGGWGESSGDNRKGGVKFKGPECSGSNTSRGEEGF